MDHVCVSIFQIRVILVSIFLSFFRVKEMNALTHICNIWDFYYVLLLIYDMSTLTRDMAY